MENQNFNQNSSGGSGVSIASMVLGIVAVIVNCWYVYVSIPCGIVGIILAAIGIKNNSSKGMAIAGLVCSIVGLAMSLIVLATGAAIYSMFS